MIFDMIVLIICHRDVTKAGETCISVSCRGEGIISINMNDKQIKMTKFYLISLILSVVKIPYFLGSILTWSISAR